MSLSLSLSPSPSLSVSLLFAGAVVVLSVSLSLPLSLSLSSVSVSLCLSLSPLSSALLVSVGRGLAYLVVTAMEDLSAHALGRSAAMLTPKLQTRGLPSVAKTGSPPKEALLAGSFVTRIRMFGP